MHADKAGLKLSLSQGLANLHKDILILIESQIKQKCGRDRKEWNKNVMEIHVKESPGNVFGTKTRNGDSKPWF